MPLDGLTLGLVADELRAALVNGRIDRIVQPERDELNLTIRNNGQNHLLLLSASADCARAEENRPAGAARAVHAAAQAHHRRPRRGR